eukprot:Lithocolla_globosa_v1_NODE_625_length_3568_cov_66.349274.p4 type:complete len:131 gc:universal NODE_625_length_3568_cov_66.349274:896-504(-)
MAKAAVTSGTPTWILSSPFRRGPLIWSLLATTSIVIYQVVIKTLQVIMEKQDSSLIGATTATTGEASAECPCTTATTCLTTATPYFGTVLITATCTSCRCQLSMTSFLILSSMNGWREILPESTVRTPLG